MNVWPLKFRKLAGDQLLFADDSGGWFYSDAPFLDRYVGDALNAEDYSFLRTGGHAFSDDNDIAYLSFLYRWSKRIAAPGDLAYVVLVPTLRCNLTCDYCQVSRAAKTAQGYDWDQATLEAVLRFLDGLKVGELKIEFQGGEPLLRLDLLEKVRDFCRARFKKCEFVVCTNLQEVSDVAWAFLVDNDVVVSTSLDGSFLTHQRNRTKSDASTAAFFGNIAKAAQAVGARRLSALPTIDLRHPPAYSELVGAFEAVGLNSIFLRPVSHHGFARQASFSKDNAEQWRRYYNGFIDYLIDYNAEYDCHFEEYYLSLCLKRALAAGHDGHVDLRNPALVGKDAILIDFDGKLYPSDEARMLARIRAIDLSVGHVADGLDVEKLARINVSAFNNFDPDCVHCVYQPFCGSDPVDNVSRYGRIDVPRASTWFCQRQTIVFDKIFNLIAGGEPKALAALSQWAGLASWPAELGRVLT